MVPPQRVSGDRPTNGRREIWPRRNPATRTAPRQGPLCPSRNLTNKSPFLYGENRPIEEISQVGPPNRLLPGVRPLPTSEWRRPHHSNGLTEGCSENIQRVETIKNYRRKKPKPLLRSDLGHWSHLSGWTSSTSFTARELVASRLDRNCPLFGKKNIG